MRHLGSGKNDSSHTIPLAGDEREERMTSVFRIRLVSLATFVGACIWLAGAASADPPQGMRLYVFSSGSLTLDKSGLQTGATGKITIPVAFFLIEHPKGNVLFDTGNNDKIITDPTYWGPLAAALNPGRSPDVAIDAQLDKIGVKPSDINYVVLGHMHQDHAGNVGTFIQGFTPAESYKCHTQVVPRLSILL
jgi:glyoxylase-like metal-dependent hydrolase (beta-lactamase superfamily II)